MAEEMDLPLERRSRSELVQRLDMSEIFSRGSFGADGAIVFFGDIGKETS